MVSVTPSMTSPTMTMNSQTPTDFDIEGTALACDNSQNNVSYILLSSLPIGAYFACLKRVEPCRFKTYIYIYIYIYTRLYFTVHDSVPGVHQLPLFNVGKNGVLVDIQIRFETRTNEV